MSDLRTIARQMGTDPETVRAMVVRAHDDPEFWMQHALGFHCWQKQREICAAVARRRNVAVPSCHAGGKSAVAGGLVVWWLQNRIPSIVVTTAPTERQTKKILWKEIRSKWRDAKFQLQGEVLDLEVRVSEDHFAFGFATTDYDQNKFQGIHSDSVMVVMDEACGLSGETYIGAAGVMAGGECRLLQLGNPVDPNTRFAEECRDSGVTVVRISAYDTPNFNIPGHELREEHFTNGTWKEVLGPRYYDAGEGVTRNLPSPYLCTPDYVDDVARKYGPTSPQYVARVLGLFPDQAEEALFSRLEYEDAAKRTIVQGPEIAEFPLELGVDVARFGRDQTVVWGVQGDRQGKVLARILGTWGKEDTVITTRKVQAIHDTCARHGQRPLAIRVDVVGVGGGVVDQLQRSGYPVVAFNSSNVEGVPAEYLNCRAHAYFHLKELLEQRRLDLPEHPQLEKQLLSIRWKDPGQGEKKSIYGKDWMKRNGFESPDFVDALMIALYPGVRSRGDYGITI